MLVSSACKSNEGNNMASKLTEFLTRLSTDSELMEAYKKDEAGTMKANGVADEHVELVLNKQHDEIKELTGGSVLKTTHSIIEITKK